MIEDFIRQWSDQSEWIWAHTSGSTGKPKDIRLAKADMIVSAKATTDFFNIGRQSFMVCPLSVDYIAGKMMWVRGKVSEAEVVFEQPSMMPLAADYNRIIDLVPIVPAQISGLLCSPNIDKIRHIIVGGAPLDDNHESLLKEFPCWATYGMTETCSHVALRRIGLEKYFTPLPGFRMSLDEAGALVIESENMSFGRLVTNDIAEILPDGRFRIIGRRDNVIISGGEKFFPEQIENRLSGILKNIEYYISSRSSRVWGEECVLVVKNTALSDEMLLGLCAHELSRHEVPKAVIRQRQFEYTSTGKLRRRKF